MDVTQVDIATWIVSALLALVFLGAGGAKVAQPKQKLEQNPQLAWTNDFSQGTIKLIGMFEVLGALGLILPWALGIASVLTPLAALGLVALMVGAIATHVWRHEQKVLPMNLVLLALAAFVAIERFAS